MTERRWLALGALVVVVSALAFLWVLAHDTTEPTPPPAPKPSPAPRVGPRSVRVPLPPPPDIQPPDLPRDRPQETRVTADDRRAMNFAVEGVLKPAREECLQPWLRTLGVAEAEFVFDAVLFDGRLIDLAMRSLQHEVPAEVLDCVADRGWYADWPEWDLEGELRLQRSMTLRAGP